MMPPAQPPQPMPPQPMPSMPAGAQPILKPPPLTTDELSAWKARLSAGRDIAKELITEGRKSMARVTAKTLTNRPTQHTVVVPLDYASVEQKKAQLFQVPEMIAEGRTPEMEPVAPLFAAITNFQLGPEGVNAPAMLFEVQPDVLIQGYAVTKIGYENVIDGTKSVATGEMQPDPAFSQPGAVLGLGAQPPQVPVMADVPNIISETYYWRRFSPGYLGAPKEFRGSNFDDAGWLSMRFSEDVLETGRGASTTATKDDELLLCEPPSTKQGATRKRHGTEVWYKASLYDEDIKHPDVIRTFKLYDDDKDVTDRRNSPFQRWVVPGDPTMHPAYVPGSQLIGMKGFPLHVLTLRYLSDTAFPPSDVQMSGSLSDEISVGRTQVLRRRDRSLPQVLYDGTRVPIDVMAKIEKNDNTGFIGVPGNPAEMFMPLDKGQFGRENFAFNDQAQNDYDKTWGHGANGGTLRAESPETATKSQQIAQSIENRLQMERSRELEWFVAGATKLMGLYQIFADAQSFAPIVGKNGQQTLQAWDRTAIPGPFVLKPRPNSHIRLSPEQEFDQMLQFFNLAGNAPEGNRTYMLQQLAVKRGLDPTRATQQPTPKGPEPMKPGVSFQGEDLDPSSPQFPIVIEILRQGGYQVSQQAVTAAQGAAAQQQQRESELALTEAVAKATPHGAPGHETEHGGAMVGGGQTSPINKHAADLTGGTPGIGVQ
jgi:hypothetical protein